MDGDLTMCFKFNGESKLMAVNDSTSFVDVLGQLVVKWDNLHVGGFSCTCSVGTISKISLECEEDLKNLFVTSKIMKVPIVHVDLLTKEFVEIPKKNSHVWSGTKGGDTNMKGKRNYTANSVEFEGDANIPHYNICPPVKKKCLLSDPWADIMKDGVGTVFRGGAVEYRAELIKYASQLGFKFKYKRNDPIYINAVCDEGTGPCDLFIRARRQPFTLYFEITKANFVHNCVGKLRNYETKRLSPKIMGNLLLSNVKNNPNASGKELRKDMKLSYGLEVPYWKAHRDAEAARTQIFGSFQDSYDQLRWYCEAIQRTNPGSVVSLETDPVTHEFQRVFICFKACLDGFKSCRPILFVDGTFMRGQAKGTMLTATAKDGDNGLFPVAFAVVSSENFEDWEWFLAKLRDFVTHDRQIFYISDRNRSLMSAFDSVFEHPVHFFCLYHLINNLKSLMSKRWTKTHRDSLVQKFKECAYAPNEITFDEKLQEFKSIGGSVFDDFLEHLPFKRWVVAHSPHITRYGEMTSIAIKSFNAWIQDARELPITHCIDHIRVDICRWIFERREASKGWTSLLVPTKNAYYSYLAELSRTWYVQICPSGDYEVSSTPSVRVGLESRSCTCCKWQVTGFPCVHAVAVISRLGADSARYIDRCFLISEYQESYKYDLNPIPETERFEYRGSFGHQKIVPPTLKIPPGRPKKQGSRHRGNFAASNPTVHEFEYC